jgi:hypothetical protein
MDTIAEGYGGITFQPEQYVRVPDAMLATTEGAGRKRSPVSDAGSPDDGVLLNAAAAAADLIGSAVRQSSHIAADLTTGVERGVKSIATGMIDSALSESGRMATELATGVERGVSSMTASLLRAIVEMDRAVAAPDGAIQQVRDEGPAPPAPGAESPPERGRQATLWPVSGLGTEPVRAVVPHARSDERATAKTPAVRTDDTNVDPQHALVERLNLLSLAAARHGQTWRPNSPRDVAETSGLP